MTRDYSTAGGLNAGCSNPYEAAEPYYREDCYGCGAKYPASDWSNREFFDEEANYIWPYCNDCAPICQWCDRDASLIPGIEWENDHECRECVEQLEEE